MTLPYFARLVVLCGAAFFLIHSGLALAVCAISGQAARSAGRLGASNAAQLLLAIRLLPSTLTLLILFGFCVPSYLWFEPAHSEEVGFVCALMALIGALAWVIPALRTVATISRTARYIRRCRQIGEETAWPGEVSPVLVLTEETPVLIIAGVIHPQLVISRRILRALDAEQMEVAVGHEQAHRLSHDNFKRLLLLLTPDVLPFLHGFDALERQWAKFAEWAADDHSAGGNSGRAVSLASALVTVAKMNTKSNLRALATSLVGNDGDLSERVDRLLQFRQSSDQSVASNFLPVLAVSVGSSIAALLVVWPASLLVVHEVLEKLIR